MKRRSFVTAIPLVGLAHMAYAATPVMVHSSFGDPLADLSTFSGTSPWGEAMSYVADNNANVTLLSAYATDNIWSGMSICGSTPTGYVSIQHGSVLNTRRQCVALVRAFSNAGLTDNWRRGGNVKNSSITTPCVIATFERTQNGQPRYQGHTAILLEKTSAGITVLDQNWHNGNPNNDMDGIVSIHFLKFKAMGVKSVSNASRYYVVEQV